MIRITASKGELEKISMPFRYSFNVLVQNAHAFITLGLVSIAVAFLGESVATLLASDATENSRPTSLLIVALCLLLFQKVVEVVTTVVAISYLYGLPITAKRAVSKISNSDGAKALLAAIMVDSAPTITMVGLGNIFIFLSNHTGLDLISPFFFASNLGLPPQLLVSLIYWILSLVVLVGFFVVVPVAIVERSGVQNILVRSWVLSRGNRRRILAVFLILYGARFVTASVFGLLSTIVPNASGVDSFLTYLEAIPQEALDVFSVCVTSVIYRFLAAANEASSIA